MMLYTNLGKITTILPFVILIDLRLVLRLRVMRLTSNIIFGGVMTVLAY